MNRSPEERLPGGGSALAVAADLVEVRRLAALLRDACTAAGVDEMAAMECELALVEAANNVVEHGYAGRDPGKLALAVRIGGGAITLELTDSGNPLPEGFFAQCPIVPLDATRGRGVAIILSCVDEVGYASDGGENRLTLTKRL